MMSLGMKQRNEDRCMVLFLAFVVSHTLACMARIAVKLKLRSYREGMDASRQADVSGLHLYLITTAVISVFVTWLSWVSWRYLIGDVVRMFTECHSIHCG